MLGFIEGITTNPQRMKSIGRSPLDALEELVASFDGHVFYQLTAQTLEARIDEAWHAYDLRPDRVIIKLPATTENLSFFKRVPEIEVAFTMVYSPLQAYAAAAAGAVFVMPYIHHSIEHFGDCKTLISQMVQLLDQFPTQVLGADIRTLEEAQQALTAGAHHITLPLELLLSMGDHPLTKQTIEEYK
jgi:transaldolase